MEAIRHIAEAALTDNPEQAKAEIEAAMEKLEQMRAALAAEEIERRIEAFSI